MNRRLAAVACSGVMAAALGAQSPPSPAIDTWYEAVRQADRSAVVSLIAKGAEVNARDRRGGATPLMYAAALGSIDTMRLLLEKGADVNARSAAGATALMWAASDPAKVRFLLDRGADVKVVSEGGRTALLLAAMSDGLAETVRFLLQRGSDPRVIDREQNSTLGAAAFGNDNGTLRQLIGAGAAVNAANAFGYTSLMWQRSTAISKG